MNLHDEFHRTLPLTCVARAVVRGAALPGCVDGLAAGRVRCGALLYDLQELSVKAGVDGAPVRAGTTGIVRQRLSIRVRAV